MCVHVKPKDNEKEIMLAIDDQIKHSYRMYGEKLMQHTNKRNVNATCGLRLMEKGKLKDLCADERMFALFFFGLSIEDLIRSIRC